MINQIREISLRSKGRVYHPAVRSILLYGCETWPVRVTDERMLAVFDNDSFRRILPYKYAGTARAKKAPNVS